MAFQDEFLPIIIGTFYGGDSKNVSLKMQYDKILPEYGFAQNKGYGSQSHIEALKRVGASPIHRRSFIKNFISEE